MSPRRRAPRLRVGLVWAGNPDHQNDHNRSLPLSALGPLAEVPGVRFFSLQKGRGGRADRSHGRRLNLVDLGDQLASFADTAAVIANLDLVISVDTASPTWPAAWATGVPAAAVRTGLAVAAEPDDSPWYPTMRVFRQPRPGDWPSVIASVVNHLRR